MRNTSSRPRPLAGYGNVLRLSIGLVVVLFMMYRASDPATWAWMFPPGAAGDKTADAQTADPAVAANAAHPLPAKLYADVRDDSLFRGGEYVPFFQTLAWLQQTPADKIVAASSGRVTYAQLYQQPDHYRGQLVTISGTLRQVSTRRRAKPAPEAEAGQDTSDAAAQSTDLATNGEDDNAQNATDGQPLVAPPAADEQQPAAPFDDSSIDRWHEFFIQPDDNPSSPILVYALELPQGMPEAGRMRQPVRVTGVFFKRLVYGAAENEPALAPLVLAKQLDVLGPDQAVVKAESTQEIMIVSCCIGLVAAGIFLFIYRQMTSGKKAAERSAEAILNHLESRRGK